MILRERNAENTYPLVQQSLLGDTPPLVLLSRRARQPRQVESNWPAVIPSGDDVVCVLQQLDGNLRVIHSATKEDCLESKGRVIFDSKYSLDLYGDDSYVTKLQRDGNLVTRKVSTMETVWSTCNTGEGNIAEYSLVLNSDDTISIVDENERVYWKSDEDPVCPEALRELVLLRSADGYERRVDSSTQEVHVDDPYSYPDICLVQQSDGSFRVLRSYGCGDNSGRVFFDTDLALSPDRYVTTLQKDGNLVTRHQPTGQWVWQSYSAQSGVRDDFSLLLNQDNSLSIIYSNTGKVIWKSTES